MTRRMVETRRDNIHATVGSITITLNPHHRSVEYRSWFHLLSATGGECKRRAIGLSRSSDATILVSCAPPPFCFAQKRLRTLPHHKRDIMYRYEGSTCPLKKTPFNRPGSKYLLSVFVNDVSMLGSYCFLGQKLNRFRPYCFLFLDVL